MKFVSFEDQTGIYEAVFFPPAYARYSHLLGAERPYVLRGRVEAEDGALTLNVHRLQLLTPLPAAPGAGSNPDNPLTRQRVSTSIPP